MEWELVCKKKSQWINNLLKNKNKNKRIQIYSHTNFIANIFLRLLVIYFSALNLTLSFFFFF